jgi:hypothetical protein
MDEALMAAPSTPATARVIPRRLLLSPTIALGALACSLVAFAPRLWLIARPNRISLEWDRAHTFLLQAADPFRSDIEIVMRWRILPALVAHEAGLRGDAPLVIPWIGLAAFMTYVAVVLVRRSGDWRFGFGGALLVATTSAVVCPGTLLGYNDAWVWLGLTVLAVEDSLIPPLVACLICPWVDERFVVGAPLAWVAGRLSRGQPLLSRDLIPPACALVVYGLLRLGLSAAFQVHTEGAHLHRMAFGWRQKFRFAPMGWWMGLRAAWIPLGLYFAWTPRPRVAGALFAATALATIALTEDQSRSAAVVIPVVVLGLLMLQHRYPDRASKMALAIGLLGLVLPAAVVEDFGIIPYENLFAELFRFWRGTTPGF